MNNLRIKSVN